MNLHQKPTVRSGQRQIAAAILATGIVISAAVLVIWQLNQPEDTLSSYTQQFTSASRANEIANCWTFASTTIVTTGNANAGMPIDGPTLRTGTLNSTVRPCRLGSPCTELADSGEIVFKHYISHLRNSTLKQLDLVAINQVDNTETLLFTHVYTNTALREEHVPVNLTGFYKFEWRWIGSGAGTQGRALMDDITIPGVYAADPSGGCACVGGYFPVEWLSVDAELRADQSWITWSTASETNTSHFSIERSEDGTLFETLGEVPAAGNSMVVRNYEFQDLTAAYKPVERLYYRIRQVDLDGTFSYSQLIELSLPFGPDGGSEGWQVYPNPATDRVTIAVYAATRPARLEITDISGRVVYAHVVAASQEIQTFMPAIHDWVPGVYLIRLADESQIRVQRLLIR